MAGYSNKPVYDARSAPASKHLQAKNGKCENLGSSWHIEQQFRTLVDSVKDYAIFVLDTQGNILYWNQGAERIKGYKSAEVIGRNFSCFYQPEDCERGAPEQALRAAALNGRYEVEGWRVRKDGSRFWANVVITALYDSQGQLIAFMKITRDLTNRLQKQQMLQISQETLRNFSNQILRAQDEERQRIGRDLHDGAGQYLAMLKMHLESLVSRMPLMETVREKLKDCIQLAEEAIKEIRTTSYQLSPPMLEECGLASVVPWFLDGFMERSGIETSYDISGFDRLPRDAEIAIFRVLQECLANTSKHSGSPTVHIDLRKEGNTLTLEVSDHGSGIPQEIVEALYCESPGKLGVGLRSIRERIHQLGGKLDVTSNERGTSIRTTVPIAEPAQ